MADEPQKQISEDGSILVRFTLDAVREIDELMPKTRFIKREELIRGSLAFLAWAIRETGDGTKVLVQTPDGEIRETKFPFWPQDS